MRQSSDLPRRRGAVRFGRRGRNALIVGIVGVIILAVLARWFARLVTDGWWFEALGQRAVLSKISRTRIELGLVFGLVAATVLYGCLLVVHRTPPIEQTFGPEDQLVARYQIVVAERGLAVRMGTAGLFGLVAGLAVAARWSDWLLLRNAVSFKQFDAVYHKDYGFYVFQLPFLSFVIEWAFTVVLAATFVTLAAHYLSGTIRLAGPRRAVSTVRVQLSILVVVLALLRAVAYWFHRYELVWSTRGYVRGLGYTDEHHVRPALLLLVLIALTTAALVVVGLRQRSWRLPMVAAASWAVVALMAGTIFPALVQRVVAHDDPARRESDVIYRNLRATRLAMGLDGTRLQTDAVSGAAVVPDETDLSPLADVRVVSPDVARAAVAARATAGGAAGSSVVTLEPSRYVIDGRAEQVYLAIPSIDPGSGASWKVRHELDVSAPPPTVVPASLVASDGQAEATSSERTTLPVAAGGKIFLSTDTRAYAVVKESDAPGATSVSLASFSRRLAFALRFGDLAVLQQTGGADRVLYVRQVVDRVRKLAPFLAVDDDAYPVVADGRVVWVIDAYTLSDRFPAAERADVGALDAASALKRPFNYVRNSAKAVVDAHTGQVTLYATDQADPVLTAWRTAFPTLFDTASAMPFEVRSHLRYPSDLLRVQTTMWGTYRTDQQRQDDAAGFAASTGAWAVAPTETTVAGVQPATTAGTAVSTTARASSGSSSSPTAGPTTSVSGSSTRAAVPVSPSYALWGTTMVAVQPMVSKSGPAVAKEDMAALVVGWFDSDGNAKLRVLRADGAIPSPATARSQLQAEIFARNAGTPLLGEQQLVRLDETFAWVLPWYGPAAGAANVGKPALGGVAVLADGKVGIGRSVEAAVEDRFGVDPGFTTVKPGAGSVAVPPDPNDSAETSASLTARAQVMFDLARRSELDGDTAKAIDQLKQAYDLATRANRLAGAGAKDGAATGSTTTTTAPGATTTTSVNA